MIGAIDAHAHITEIKNDASGVGVMSQLQILAGVFGELGSRSARTFDLNGEGLFPVCNNNIERDLRSDDTADFLTFTMLNPYSYNSNSWYEEYTCFGSSSKV